MNTNNYGFFTSVLRTRPHAAARVYGSGDFPKIRGFVRFYGTKYGVLVAADIQGLPVGTGACGGRVFGFHIHSGLSCTGNASDPFADTLAHYDTANCQHPYHAGDMPPLFGNNGNAFSVFLTNRFNIGEIIGKTVVIHDMPDDFKTQPSGGSGTKIACGLIRRV